MSVDLREWGLMTPSRDQENCGACWAFGTIAVLENAALHTQTSNSVSAFRKNASAIDLSEQFVLRNYFARKGLCDGDNAVSALNYMYDNAVNF